MTPLATLDAALTAAIQAGATRFSALVAAVHETAMVLAPVDAAGRRDVDALVERRLQALRSAGAVTLGTGGWTLAAAQPPLALRVTSRRLTEYLLLDLGQGQAWRPRLDGADPRWRAVLPNPVGVLQALAEGRLTHRAKGGCPNEAAPALRDPACPVCQALDALTPVLAAQRVA